MSNNENIFFDLKRIKYLGKNVKIGKTVRIRYPEKTSIGDNSIIDDFVYISCDLDMGKYSHISANCSIVGGKGHVKIGNYVGISPGSSLIAQSSEYTKVSFELPSIPSEISFGGKGSFINIGDHVLIGAHSIILPNVSLPDGVASTAKTIFRKKKYEPWFLYHGEKAKKLRKRDNTKLLEYLKENSESIK